MKIFKKLFSAFTVVPLALSMFAGLPVSADVSEDTALKVEVKKANSITMDGILTESDWSDKQALKKQIIGSTAEINADFRTTWDNDNFYLGVEVTGVKDNTDFEKNSITYYFSPDNFRGTPYSKNDFQVQIFDKGATIKAGAPGMGKNDSITTKDINVKYKSQTNGYTMEIAMPWTVVGSIPKQGADTIGFDMMAFSNDESSVMVWSGSSNNWKDTTDYGTLKFTCDGTEGVNLTCDKPKYPVGDSIKLNLTGVNAGDSVSIFKKGEETTLNKSLCTKNITSDIVSEGKIEFQKNDFSADGLPVGEYIAAIIKGGKILKKCPVNIADILGAGWYRGDNHMHSTYSDGIQHPVDVAKKLKSLGTNYATLTDHNSTGGKAEFESEETNSFIPLIGEEVTRWDGHFLAYDIKHTISPSGSPQDAIDRVLNDNPGKSFCYIAHPMWSVDMTQGGDWEWHDWSVTGYTGLEVWNANYPHNYDQDYSIAAFKKWDELNNQGRQLYGICNTDAHVPECLGLGWNMNYVESLTKENILNSLRKGTFYGTNGPEINFTVDGNMMGSVIKLSGSTVSIDMSANCDSNLTKINLIKNGEVINTWSPNAKTWSKKTDVPAKAGDFFRMTAEGTNLFAFSNPVFTEKPMISTTKTVFNKDEDIKVTFKDNNGTGSPAAGGLPKDWIGIYKEGEKPGTTGVSTVSYSYLNGITTPPSTAIKNGTVNLKNLPIGDYYIGFFTNDGWDEISEGIHISVQDLPKPSISTDKVTFKPNEKISVTFNNNNGTGSPAAGNLPKDWIGIYKDGETPGTSGVSSVRFAYLNGLGSAPSTAIKDGTVSFEGLPEGKYYIGFFSNDVWDKISEGIHITVTDKATPTITTSKNSFKTTEDISVDFKNNNGSGLQAAGGTAKDWIGIYKEGDIPGTLDYSVEYCYLNGTETVPDAAIENGTVNLEKLPEGKYFIGFFADGDYKEISERIPFIVTDLPAPYITTTNPSYEAGKPVEINFFNNNGTGYPGAGGSATDWVALFQKSDTPNDIVDSVAWKYLNGTKVSPLSAIKSGTVEFTDLPEGEYYAVLLSSGAFDKVCDSVAFTITPHIPTISEQLNDMLNSETNTPFTIASTSNSDFSDIKAQINLSDLTASQKEALKSMTDEQINAEIAKITDVISTINTTKTTEKAKAKIADIKNSLPADTVIIPINFTKHAEFALPVEISINVDKTEYKAETYYLYYYNEETGKVEYCTTVTISTEGIATFKISHCSDYFISGKKIDLENINADKNNDKPSEDTEKPDGNTEKPNGNTDKPVNDTTTINSSTVNNNSSDKIDASYKSDNPKTGNSTAISLILLSGICLAGLLVTKKRKK